MSSADPAPPPRGGGRASIVLFAMIAALMATDLTIEFRRGVPLALQSFEVLIFLSALAGFAFHWWQMTAARRRSQQLDHELAEAWAEVTRWAEDARRWNREAQQVLQGLGEAIDASSTAGASPTPNARWRSCSSKGSGIKRLPSHGARASGPFGSKRSRCTESPGSPGEPTSPPFSSKICCCPGKRSAAPARPAAVRQATKACLAAIRHLTYADWTNAR